MLRLLILCLLAAAGVQAQDRAYDQSVVGSLLERDGTVPDAPVRYATYRVEHPSGNSVLARHDLYRLVGEGDAERGRERLHLAQLLGGPSPGTLRNGDTLVLPARPADFDLGALAYAPYPRAWPGAVAIAKVVVVDKTTQTWAAYANGLLVRWGPASTGAAATPTPTGRFTMNWRALERESTEAPPGETWLMRYVMNIHLARGIHLHQYDVVPTGPPQGHGCIRMVTADAEWLYAWSDGWRATSAGRVTRPGTLVIVQGTEPEGTPVRFVDGPDGPERVTVVLPPDPMQVPRGDR
jgi:lipoprotein-anchoring transpeptidase ErfK/SrfK